MKTLRYIAAAVLVFAAFGAQAQQAGMKKPTLMVVPGDTWCVSNGYSTQVNDQGKVHTVPDYEAALRQDMDLVNVITKIGELMAERGFPLKDLSSEIRSNARTEAEDALTVSRTSGATIAETPLERLTRRAKSDINVEVTWKVNAVGPKRSVTYNLRGLDSYTNKQIAAAQGTGPASFSAEVPVLLEEAVLEKMDQFISQLDAHFADIMENGREITLRLQMFDTGSGLSFEDEYDGTELSEIVENWVYDNTQAHRFSLTDSSENEMLFEQVRVPAFDERGRATDARMFARGLTKFLRGAPYNIVSKSKAGGGLGKATLILGEK